MRGKGALLHWLEFEGMHRGSMHDHASNEKGLWPEEIELLVAETKDVT